MKLRLPVAIVIFLSSYFPLSMILLAQNFDYGYLSHELCRDIVSNFGSCIIPLKTPYFAIGIFIGCMLCFLGTMATLSAVRANQTMEIISAKHVPADLMNYVLPYVVSFMSVDYQESGKFVGFIIFLIWMFWIGYASGLTILNPMLSAFGWQLYELEYKFPAGIKSYSCVALSRKPLEATDTHAFASVQQVYIIK